jgi:hypothetical protein
LKEETDAPFGLNSTMKYSVEKVKGALDPWLPTETKDPGRLLFHAILEGICEYWAGSSVVVAAAGEVPGCRASC